MFIKFLTIEKDVEVIRQIIFKEGVNLIIDTPTPSENDTVSGNNVGKTTVLRLIDYCLGGKSEPIYTDLELKTINLNVKSFLEDSNVIITLCLGDSFENSDNDVTVKRNFLKKTERKAEINGENYTNDKNYCSRLNQLLFNTDYSKPTLREIIPRFIRCDSTRMDRVIKYLHSTTTDNTYESIYLFFFGRADTTELSAEKNERNRSLQFCKKVISETFNSRTSEALKQHLSVIAEDIKQLEAKKKTFNVNPKYEQEFSTLQNIKSNINRVSSNLAEAQFRYSLLIDSIEEIKSQTSEIDIESLRTVYEEARFFIPKLQKSFEDSLAFHNKLVANKLVFLSADLPKLDTTIQKYNHEFNELRNEERILGEKIIKTGSLADYEALVSKANQKYEQKGRLEEELEKLETLENDINQSSVRIAKINHLIEGSEEKLRKHITKFNKYFSSYSEKFYDEQFVFSSSFDPDARVIKFKISNVQGNLGDGKKKGLIAAFDLAYISYANDENLKSPRFAIHDRIEGIHGNQLRSLFDIVNSQDFKGQYIVSVLSGKFSELQLAENYLTANTILELSQSDKLFKIPG